MEHRRRPSRAERPSRGRARIRRHRTARGSREQPAEDARRPGAPPVLAEPLARRQRRAGPGQRRTGRALHEPLQLRAARRADRAGVRPARGPAAHGAAVRHCGRPGERRDPLRPSRPRQGTLPRLPRGRPRARTRRGRVRQRPRLRVGPGGEPVGGRPVRHDLAAARGPPSAVRLRRRRSGQAPDHRPRARRQDAAAVVQPHEPPAGRPLPVGHRQPRRQVAALQPAAPGRHAWRN